MRFYLREVRELWLSIFPLENDKYVNSRLSHIISSHLVKSYLPLVSPDRSHTVYPDISVLNFSYHFLFPAQ